MEINAILSSLPGYRVAAIRPGVGQQHNEQSSSKQDETSAVYTQSSKEDESGVVVDFTTLLDNAKKAIGAADEPEENESADDESRLVKSSDSEHETDSPDDLKLTEAEEKELQELKARDAEVRTHERAHMAAAGSYAQGGPVFDLQEGPDGKRYAVGGHVSIDSSAEDSPEATIQKMRVIQSAAMAPGDPSTQDFSVARSAAAKEMQARKELSEDEIVVENKEDKKPHPSNKHMAKFTHAQNIIDTETAPTGQILSIVA